MSASSTSVAPRGVVDAPTTGVPIAVAPTVDSPATSTLAGEARSPHRRAVDTPASNIRTADGLAARSSIAGSPTASTPTVASPGSGVSSTAILPTGGRRAANIFDLVRLWPYDDVLQDLQDPERNWDFHKLYITRQYNGEPSSQNVIFSVTYRAAGLGHHLDLLKFFHDAGVDMKHKDGRAQTALFYAAKNGLTDCVEFMLFAGDNDPNELDCHGETSLFFAARSGRIDTIKLLLESNADPNVRSNRRNMDPNTVLMEACWNAMSSDVPDPTVVKFLIQHKAEVNSPEGARTSPLREAVKALCYDKNSLKPLDSLRKDYTIVKILLDAGADIEWTNIAGETALFPAVRGNHKDLVEELIAKYNADVFVRNTAGKSLIMCSTANTPMADMLQENRSLRYHMLPVEENGSNKRSYAEAFGPEDVPQQPQKAPSPSKNVPQHAQHFPLRRSLKKDSLKDKKEVETSDTVKKDAPKKDTVKNDTANKDTAKKDTGKKETAKKTSDKKGNDDKAKSKKGTDKKGQDKKGTDKKGQDKKGQDKKGQDKKGQDKKGLDKVDVDKKGKNKDGTYEADLDKMSAGKPSMDLMEMDELGIDTVNVNEMQGCELDEPSSTAEKVEPPPPDPFRTVQFGTLEEIKHMFEVGKEDHDQMDSQGQNCVHAAAKRQTEALEVIQYLTTELGVHAMFCDNSFAWNPLFHAVVNGNEDCIQFLVDNNCDPNHVDKNSLTVIMHAVTEGATSSVKLLHSLGAKIDTRNPVGGDSLAHIAASKGFEDILGFMLENGLSGTEENDQGYTPLHLALTGQCVEMLLDQGAAVEQVDKYGNGPIFAHIRYQRVDSVQKLLERQCSPNCTDMDSRTCIMAAVESNSLDIVKLLIEFKADLSATDKKGCTPEKLAERLGRKAISRAFAAENDRIMKIAQEQEYFDTQLKSSVMGGAPLVQLKQWINKYKSDPKRLWGTGKMETLLFFAVSRPTADVCDVALFLMDEHGLDPAFVDLQGETALFNAVAVSKDPNVAVAKLLLERTCDPHQVTVKGITALFEAVKFRNIKCVNLLLEHKVDVNHRSLAGENALFCARTADMAKRLIDADADVTVVNAKGRSCLFGLTDVEMVKLLLEQGCSVNVVDSNGENCLFEAVKHQPGTALIEMLLEKGALPTLVNHMGQTCLHRALADDNVDGARMLVDKYNLDPFLNDKNEVSPIKLAEQREMDSFITFINAREKRIREEHAKKTLASKDLQKILFDGGTLEEVKAFVKQRPPLFDFVDKTRFQSHIFYAVSTSSSARSDDDTCELVNYLIEMKADPTVTDRCVQTALFFACRYAGPKTCRVLIDSKCEVNHCDSFSETPLSYAARSTNDTKMHIIDLLFERKADPNIQTSRGHTELMQAVDRNDIPMVNKLLQRSADLEVKNALENDRTVLFAASENKTTEVLEILLAAGANVNAVNDENRTPLFGCYCENGARLLVEAGANPNHLTNLKQNALFACTSVPKLHALVDLKCDINQLDSNGQTCLFAGMLHGGPQICERLIRDYRLDPFQVDTNGLSCMDMARSRLDRPEFLDLIHRLKCLRLDLENILKDKTIAEFDAFGDPGDLTYLDPETKRHYGFVVASRDPTLPDTAEFLQRLQNAQCDLTAVDSLGRTCFFTAAESGNIDAMRFLIDIRCNVNENDKNQKTPLFAAVRGGDVRSFKFLIDNHANKNARSEVLGESLVFDAIRSGKEDVVKAVLDISKNPEFELERHNFEQMTPLIEAVIQDKTSVIEMVLSYGATVDTKGPDQKSALFYCKSASACRLLLNQKADAHMVDSNGRTPLFEAVTRGDREVVRALVAVGAEVNWRDNIGRTPVFCCVEEEEDNNTLQTLLDLGADLDITDANGQTPLTLAKGSKKRKNVSSFVTNLKKRIVVKSVKKTSPAATKGARRDKPLAVRLTPIKKLDGRLEQCAVTFYDPKNPDVIVPYDTEEYKACWNDLKRENPDLLALLEYPQNTPWTTGP